MKTKDIRRVLAESMAKAAKGELAVEDGRNIIGLANQISQSMAVEVKVQIMKERVGQQADKFGHLDVDN